MLLSVLKHTQPFTVEYFALKNDIFKKISDEEDLTESDIDMETQLQNLVKENISMKKKILRSDHPLYAKQVMYKKYKDMSELNEGNEEYYKKKIWLEDVLKVPTTIKSLLNSSNSDEISNKLLKIQKNMEGAIYGQSKVKERIIEIMGSMLINSKDYRSCMAMVGEPGVGKTVFARCLANALDLPFHQISLGGITDSSHIVGHSATYIGATPGEIVKGLIKMGHKNGILFIDEFDKIKEKGKDVSDAFLHILDYSQNKEFKDLYMPEISIDLSNLIIIISINDYHNVDSIVADRMPVVMFKGYKTKDKVNIGMNYFVPKIKKRLDMKTEDVVIDKKIMKYIVKKSHYKDVPGVRQLEQNLDRIFERINIMKTIYDSSSNELNLSYAIPDFKIPFILTKKYVNKLFDEYVDSDDSDTDDAGFDF